MGWNSLLYRYNWQRSPKKSIKYPVEVLAAFMGSINSTSGTRLENRIIRYCEADHSEKASQQLTGL